MQTIKLQFSAQHKIGSMLIRWRDWSDYSHVDTILKNDDLLGARGDGVKIRLPYPISKCAIRYIEVTDKQAEDYYSFLHAQIGKKYDYAGIIGFVTNRDWQQDDSWICSELIMAALAYAGIKILNTTHLNRISPPNMMLSLCLNEVGHD